MKKSMSIEDFGREIEGYISQAESINYSQDLALWSRETELAKAKMQLRNIELTIRSHEISQ